MPMPVDHPAPEDAVPGVGDAAAGLLRVVPGLVIVVGVVVGGLWTLHAVT